MHVRTHTNVVRTPSTWCIHNTEHNTSPMIMRQFDALARCRCRRRRRRPAMNALLFVYSFSSVESWWMLLFWCRRRWIDMIWQKNVVQSAPFDLSAAGRPNPHTHTWIDADWVCTSFGTNYLVNATRDACSHTSHTDFVSFFFVYSNECQRPQN